MNRKPVFFASATAIAVILAVIVMVGRSITSQKTLTLSQPIATNFRYPAQVSPTEAYYFNGSTFMAFDIQSQTSRALTPAYSLPNVTNIKWSKDAALFQATSYTNLDQLQSVLTTKHLPTSFSYWWLVNFKTGAINLVGSPKGPTSDAPVSNGTIVNDTVWSKDGGTFFYLQTQNLKTQKPVTTLNSSSVSGGDSAIATVKATSLLWADNAHIIAKSDHDNQHSLDQIDLKSKQSRTLSDIAGPVFVSTDGENSLRIAIKTNSTAEGFSGSSGMLQLLNFGSSKAKKIEQQFSGTATWSLDGNAWIAIETEGTIKKPTALGFLDDGSGKIFRVTLKAISKQKLPQHLTMVGFEDGRLLAVDGSNNAYLSAAELPSLKTVQIFNPESWNISGQDQLTLHGLTSIQTREVEYALYQFALNRNTAIESLAFDNFITGARGKVSSSTPSTANFNTTLNQSTTYKTKIDFINLASIRLDLYDKNDKLVYDSSIITSQNLD